MRSIFSLLLIGILFSQDENNNFTFTIYPELVGAGGAPSFNIEFPVSEYSIRVCVGMVVMQAELYPIIIYKSTGKSRSKSEMGAGLIFIDDGSIDNGYMIIDKFKQKYRHIFLLRNKKNFGQTYCYMNAGSCKRSHNF